MEVRSEQGVIPSREQFSAAMPKSPGLAKPPPPQLPSPTMRLAYTSDGTVVYKPITTSSPHPPTQVSGGPASTNASTEVGNGSLPPPSMPSREQFSAAMPKSPGPAQPQPQQQLPSPTLRLTYTSDGTIVYKPITTSSPHPTNQVSGGPASANASTEVGNGSLPPPLMPNMRMAYTQGGTPVYKPVPTTSPPPYQGGGGGPGGTNAVTEGANGSLPAMSTPPGLNFNIGEPLKRKRGRPRKYGPDGTMALALIPAPRAQPGAGGFSPSSCGTTPFSSSSAEAKRKPKGRPPGSGKKQQMAALGSAGTGFTPHVITVKTGEDVSSKVMSFSQHGPRAVCVLSANGAISNVTLRQPATSGGTVTYEGRFEILSLSGSFMLSVSENEGQRSRTGGLSVSLAGPDGRVLGGGVAGQLTAASPVQVVVGSFIADAKKEPKPVTPSNPIFTPGNLAPSAPIAPTSPPSRCTQSESSGGPGSPQNQSAGTCNNSNLQEMSTPWK